MCAKGMREDACQCTCLETDVEKSFGEVERRV